MSRKGAFSTPWKKIFHCVENPRQDGRDGAAPPKDRENGLFSTLEGQPARRKGNLDENPRSQTTGTPCCC